MTPNKIQYIRTICHKNFFIGTINLLILISLTMPLQLKAQNSGSFIDTRDGQTYQWSILEDGNRWIINNINYSSTKTAGYCYEDNEKRCETHGRLYSFEAAKTACPAGWKLPSRDDFSGLLNKHGDSEYVNDWSEVDNFYYIWNEDVYFNLMKIGSNQFNGQLGGYFVTFFETKIYTYNGLIGSYWSASEVGLDEAWYLNLNQLTHTANVRMGDKTLGQSVRCISSR